MHLVEVDVVGVERSEAGVDPSPDPGRAGITHDAKAFRAQPALGGDDDLFARQVSQRSRQKVLRLAKAVALSRIEEGHSLVSGFSDGLGGGHSVRWSPFATELPCAECDSRDLESAPAQNGVSHNALHVDGELRLGSTK